MSASQPAPAYSMQAYAGYSEQGTMAWSPPTKAVVPNIARAFLHADHGPLWSLPEVQQLAQETSATKVDFSMCNFGAPWQKRTTLMYTPGFESWLAPLRRLECTHTSHESDAGGTQGDDDGWNSRASVAEAPRRPALGSWGRPRGCATNIDLQPGQY